MAEMTAETKAFFAREDVRAFVASVRSEFPDAQFGDASWYRGPDRRAAYAELIIYSPGRDRYVSAGVGEIFTVRRWLAPDHQLSAIGRREWLCALHEGRALIEDSGSDEAGGSTREGELADGQVTEEALVTSAPSRPVCECGQEIVRAHFLGKPGTWCGDCAGAAVKHLDALPLDTRIAAARKADPDPTDEWRAWATPSAEGESW